MNRTFREQLTEWEKKNMKGNRRNKRRKNKRREEELSFRDIEQLMGTRRPIYTRGKGGAYRQR